MSPNTTKVQVKKSRTDQEPRIHEILKDHRRYFAPAEKVQPVSLKSLSKHELKTSPSAIEYVRVTSRDIGSQTLEERVKDYSEKLPSSTREKVEDYYEHIVAGLSKLKDAHIVHFNIQPSCIIYSSSEFYPVLTGFGEAFILEDLLKDETMKSVFSKPHPPNRCAEAICISAIIEDPEWKTKKINISNLEAVLTEYLEPGDAQLWKTYIQKFAKKEGKAVVDGLLRNWHTWDLCSVNCIFVRTLYPSLSSSLTLPGEPYKKLVF